MHLKTEPYIDLLQQLRMVAVNSTNLEKRKRMRDNMLRLAVRICNAACACICQHDFEAQETLVHHDFVGRNDIELDDGLDVGRIYPESELGSLVPWLYQEQPQRYILRTADLDPESAEYAEFAPYNLGTVIYLPIFRDEQVWGYLEIWETRSERQYAPAELEKLEEVAAAIGESLLTVDG